MHDDDDGPDNVPLLHENVALPLLPFVDVAVVDEPELARLVLPEHEALPFQLLNVAGHELGAVQDDDDGPDNVPLLHEYVALPLLPFVDVAVVDEPELTRLVLPEHEALPFQLLNVDEHEEGAVQLPDCCVNVPLLHEYVALPLLPFVDVAAVVKPELVRLVLPEHGTPDTVQVGDAAAHEEGAEQFPDCFVKEPLLQAKTALP